MSPNNSARIKRDSGPPNHLAAYYFGKVTDVFTPTRTRDGEEDEGTSLDKTPKRSVKVKMSLKEKVKFLEDQVSDKDEQIRNLSVLLNEKTEQLNKRCEKCSVNVVAVSEGGAGQQPVVGGGGEGGDMADSNTENIESNDTEEKVKKLEMKLGDLTKSFDQGFKDLAKLIADSNKPTFSQMVRGQNHHQQQQQQQHQHQQHHQHQQQQPTQQPNHDSNVSPTPTSTSNQQQQFRGRHYVNNTANNNDYLDRLRHERRTFMLVFKLSESSGSLENQVGADLALVHEMLDVMELGQYKCKIRKTTRLGRPESNSVNRPLRVEFASNLDREAVIRNGYLLARSEEFRGVGVSRDLIKEDRIVSRNNYLMKQQNKQNEASAVTSEATSPNVVEETPAETSNEMVPATQGNTDSAATEGGDQAPPRLVGGTSDP